MNPGFAALLLELSDAEARFMVVGGYAVSLDEAWADRAPGRLGGLEVPFLGGEALIRNKRALGRARDLADLESLEPGT